MRKLVLIVLGAALAAAGFWLYWVKPWDSTKALDS
jgi:hypothetical protein